MENGYYWISIKDEVSEIAFYSDKTKLFYRIGTGYGLSVNEVEVYNRVVEQSDATSDRGFHIACVVGSAFEDGEKEHYKALQDCCNQLLDAVDVCTIQVMSVAGLRILLNRK